MTHSTPEILVEPVWLEARLGDPKVRVFDCTLTRVPQPDGASRWESGQAAWETSHIPGASYLHMVDDLSAPRGTIPYGLPEPKTVGDLLSSLGVTHDTTIVLYGDGGQSVVHRIWWVLTASGLAHVRVLDGGWQRWRAEDRPIESGSPTLLGSARSFPLEPRPNMTIERGEVARAVNDADTILVHSLTSDQFAGTGGQVYRRPGRIPGSINIPASTLLQADSSRFRPIDELHAIFADANLDDARTIVPYCGGGIAAATVFLGLTLAGYDNVRLYDGSLLDWTADPEAPMVTDADSPSSEEQ